MYPEKVMFPLPLHKIPSQLENKTGIFACGSKLSLTDLLSAHSTICFHRTQVGSFVPSRVPSRYATIQDIQATDFVRTSECIPISLKIIQPTSDYSECGQWPSQF